MPIKNAAPFRFLERKPAKKIGYFSAFALSFLLSLGTALAQGEQGFSTVILPTAATDENQNPIRIDVGEISLADVPAWLDRAKSVLPPTEVLTVAVYIPRELPRPAADSYVAQVESSFAGRKVKITRVVADASTGAVAVSNANRELEQLKLSRELPLEPVAIDSAIAANQEQAAQVKSWSGRVKEFASTAFSPKKTLVVGSVINAARGGLSATLWIASGFNPYYASLAAIDGYLTYWFGKRAVAYNDWVLRHEIPFWKSNPLVRFYDRSRAIKTFVFNMAVWSIAYRTFQNTLVYLGAEGTKAGPLSPEILRDVLILGTLHTAIGALTADGVAGLASKGYASKVAQSYILWSLSLAGQVAVFAQVQQMNDALPWILASYFGAQAGLYLTAKVLPAKSPRFVVLHPLLGEGGRSDATAIEPLYKSLAAKDMPIDELAKELAAIEERIKLQARQPAWRLRVKDGFAVVANWVKGSCERLGLRFRSQ